MGVDLGMYVRPDVDARYAADVLGVLAGLPTEVRLHHRGSSGEYLSADVEGVTVRGAEHSPGMGIIELTRPALLSYDSLRAYFHYGSRFRGQLWNQVSVRSTPFWGAIGRSFINFFGGALRYCDSGPDVGENVDAMFRTCPVDADRLIPDDGEPWNEYQRAVGDLDPITLEDMQEAKDMIAYTEADWDSLRAAS